MQEIRFPITKADLKISWFSGTGAGGQHRNKHQNCCRIIHIASGLSAISQEHRERTINQRKAFRRLATKLVSASQNQEARERYGSTETIRTYHKPDNRVKDHASGLILSWDKVVGRRDLSDMIDARRAFITSHS